MAGTSAHRPMPSFLVMQAQSKKKSFSSDFCKQPIVIALLQAFLKLPNKSSFFESRYFSREIFVISGHHFIFLQNCWLGILQVTLLFVMIDHGGIHASRLENPPSLLEKKSRMKRNNNLIMVVRKRAHEKNISNRIVRISQLVNFFFLTDLVNFFS